MKAEKRALLFIGSPKHEHVSSCVSLGTLLGNALRKNGVITDQLLIVSLIKSKEGIDKMIAAINNTDILVFLSPLYVDSLPYLVIKAMELIRAARNNIIGQKRLAAISLCGFPEAYQNDIAIHIYERFALELNFEWLGGLAVGMGPAIVHGRQMLEPIGAYYRMRRAIKTTAFALSRLRPIPKKAIETIAKPFVPSYLYVFMAVARSKMIGIKNRAGNLHAKPYVHIKN